MDRKEKILQHINKKGHGIEIGPSHSPVAPKKEGFNVHIIDHLNRDMLIAKYKDHHINEANIEEVDFVWHGESYAELTGRKKYYDWIIASHVIEHAPDIITFLNDCDAVLKDDGVISLVIPDKRYCFDYYRPVTGIAKIIDNHFQKATIHTPGTVAEYFLNVVSRSGNIAWDFKATEELTCIHSLADARQAMDSVVNEKEYVDVHAWCFVPHAFRLLIHDLYSLGLIAFQEVDFFPTDAFEFYVTLGRKGGGVQESRMELLQAMESEVQNDVSRAEMLKIVEEAILNEWPPHRVPLPPLSTRVYNRIRRLFRPSL